MKDLPYLQSCHPVPGRGGAGKYNGWRLSRAAARAKKVERLVVLLGAFVHRFNGLEGELNAQGSSVLAVFVVFAFPGQRYY